MTNPSELLSKFFSRGRSDSTPVEMPMVKKDQITKYSTWKIIEEYCPPSLPIASIEVLPLSNNDHHNHPKRITVIDASAGFTSHVTTKLELSNDELKGSLFKVQLSNLTVDYYDITIQSCENKFLPGNILNQSHERDLICLCCDDVQESQQYCKTICKMLREQYHYKGLLMLLQTKPFQKLAVDPANCGFNVSAEIDISENNACVSFLNGVRELFDFDSNIIPTRRCTVSR